MRAPGISCLLAAAVVGLALAGCASQPKEAQPEQAIAKRTCAEEAANPLHLTTLRQEPPHDPEVDALLTQKTSDPRLLYINHQMYQTLHALDVELRRQQEIAACERNSSDAQTMQAQATPSPDSGNGPRTGASGSAGGASATSGVIAAPTASGGASGNNAGPAPVAAINSVATAPGNGAGGAGRTALIHKSSLPPTSGGGNGATAQKVSAGSDNDIVARRLRKAAEQETDPVVKAKLWKEYAQYQQGSGVK